MNKLCMLMFAAFATCRLQAADTERPAPPILSSTQQAFTNAINDIAYHYDCNTSHHIDWYAGDNQEKLDDLTRNIINLLDLTELLHKEADFAPLAPYKDLILHLRTYLAACSAQPIAQPEAIKKAWRSLMAHADNLDELLLLVSKKGLILLKLDRVLLQPEKEWISDHIIATMACVWGHGGRGLLLQHLARALCASELQHNGRQVRFEPHGAISTNNDSFESLYGQGSDSHSDAVHYQAWRQKMKSAINNTYSYAMSFQKYWDFDRMHALLLQYGTSEPARARYPQEWATLIEPLGSDLKACYALCEAHGRRTAHIREEKGETVDYPVYLAAVDASSAIDAGPVFKQLVQTTKKHAAAWRFLFNLIYRPCPEYEDIQQEFFIHHMSSVLTIPSLFHSLSH